LRPGQKKAAHHGFASAFGSTRYQDPRIFELFSVDMKGIASLHLGISSVAQI
jgi:hypothetical protein